MPPILLSRRVAALRPSVTIAMMNRAMQMRREGRDVVSFSAGEPDFDTPEPVKQAAMDALKAGRTKYMPTFGPPEARAAIARKLSSENSIPAVTGDHVAISAGAKHALYVVCQCLFDQPSPAEAADELLLPVPTWVSYEPLAQLAGAKVVHVHTTAETGFKMTAGQLRQAITPRTRAVLLNTPSNPCGTMYARAELDALAEVVSEAASRVAPNLVIITDEIYEKITFGNIPHYSIGSHPGVAERTITINGLSKAYAMTGWRIGYAACPGEFGLRLNKAMSSLQGQMTTNITSFAYAAIPVALEQCADSVARMCDAFRGRARIAYDLVSRIEPFKCARPEGAFYLWPDVSACFGTVTPAGKRINSALDLAEGILQEALVATVPGEDFGGCGGNHIRISFACSEREIERGLQRIGEFVSRLRR